MAFPFDLTRSVLFSRPDVSLTIRIRKPFSLAGEMLVTVRLQSPISSKEPCIVLLSTLPAGSTLA